MRTDEARARALAVVEHKGFQRLVVVLIVFNAVTLGLETSERMMSEYGTVLHVLDRATLAVFVLELLLRFYGYGNRFFHDAWNVFDVLVIGIALVPAAGPLAVLRTLRVLRVLRLVSAVPSMKRVVSGLLAAVPGMASVASLLALVIFVAGVMATKLFGGISPAYFGDLGTSLFTLFQIMTGEAWPEVARSVMDAQPLAWIFFVIYILVSSFAVLNLFIAVVVSGMEDSVTSDLAEAEERNAAAQARSDAVILEEVRALREEIAALRAERDLD
jgi:voltage-gated sodium channel